MFSLKPAWWQSYRRNDIVHDGVAGLVVALMLIPQGLAYATLAGLPPVYGLYSALLPLICYAFFGTSSVLSVGPVAITSLLTASTLASMELSTTADYIAVATLLALISGIFLFIAGMLRLGALSQMLSHPVVNAFIAGAAALIIISQIKPILGVQFEARGTIATLVALKGNVNNINWLSVSLGGSAVVFLLLSRRYSVRLLLKCKMPHAFAVTMQRMMPMFVLLLGALLVHLLNLSSQIQVVGKIPVGTPEISLPNWNQQWLEQLWLPALLIGLLGFVESFSIAQAFARKTRSTIDANAELRALGIANVGSALTSGYPVTGGFSRTLVNAEAGARSPLAGVFSAAIVLLSLWVATELFAYLPITLLAAIIVSAAVQLISVKNFKQTWQYDRLEASAMLITTFSVLLLGVEMGVGIGVLMSLITVVWRSSRPHVAVVGRIADTEHFRNIHRHQVETHPKVLMLRIDENLFFANAIPVSEQILESLNQCHSATELVLVMSSVSRIDFTAVEMLEELNQELLNRNVRLHLAEVKGPVSDRLNQNALLKMLSGSVFLSAHQAYEKLKI